MDIDALVKPYVEEDEQWSLTVLADWLITKKGIPPLVAEYAMTQALADLESGKVTISSHRGPDGVDNYVLGIARQETAEINSQVAQSLRTKIQQAVDAADLRLQGGRVRKAWNALLGRI